MYTKREKFMKKWGPNDCEICLLLCAPQTATLKWSSYCYKNRKIIIYSSITVHHKHTKVVKYFFKPVNQNLQITDVNSTQSIVNFLVLRTKVCSFLSLLQLQVLRLSYYSTVVLSFAAVICGFQFTGLKKYFTTFVCL